MDYLKYVPILNLVLIVILFILWFNKSYESFKTDSTYSLDDSHVSIDEDGNTKPISMNFIRKLIKNTLITESTYSSDDSHVSIDEDGNTKPIPLDFIRKVIKKTLRENDH